MLLYAVQFVFMAICSALQIHLYTPFKSRPTAALFGAVTAVTACCFQWMRLSPGAGLAALNLVMAALASLLGLRCCKTELYCGIYNVIIQLCINGIALDVSYTAAGLISAAAMTRSLLRVGLCSVISAAWMFIMYRLRHAVWVYMPMPDPYYRGVMVIVCLDYLLILGGSFFPAAAQLSLMLVCLVVVIAVLHAIRMPQFVIQERERTQMLLYQQRAMQAYIDSYRQSEENIRTLRHDLKHMVDTVTQLMEDREYDKAREISRQMAEWVDRAGRPEYSSNPLVNAILTDYAGRFAAADVPLKISARLTSDICMSDLELTTLLHNVLSNALEYACSPERKIAMWVNLKLSTNRSYFVLECSNPLETPPRMEGGKILSSKEDEMLHGIGLESIKRIVERYDGETLIRTDDERFVIRLMLLNRPQEPSFPG